MSNIREKTMNIKMSLQSLPGLCQPQVPAWKSETHLEEKKSAPFRPMKKDRPNKYNQRSDFLISLNTETFAPNLV